MKILKAIIAGLFIQSSIISAEDVTLVATSTPSSYYTSSTKNPSAIITLNQGDTAKCLFWEGNADYLLFKYSVDSNTFECRPVGARDAGPVITGPATIQIETSSGYKAFATFSITRAGLSSPHAAIPQEVGTTWDVILESSSDLINWTPTNPGEYGGTEPKRFFRTRMVKR
jgi:hypothetical protein